MPGEGEKEKGGEWDRTHSSGPMFEASHAPSSTRSGADSASPGQANGADVMRLKARAEILARKIENTSRQMANLADATGRHMEAKSPKSVSPGVRSWKSSSPKAAKATELGHVRECSSLHWHPTRKDPCSRRACILPCCARTGVCECARARVCSCATFFDNLSMLDACRKRSSWRRHQVSPMMQSTHGRASTGTDCGSCARKSPLCQPLQS
jgi:hypothetical protein